MFPPVDTRNVTAVAAFVEVTFAKLYPQRPQWTGRLFRDVEALFGGKHPEYAAVDLRYHDFQHTLQATVCLVEILAGRHAAAAEPQIGARQFELAVSGALLHDAGYLKLRSDTSGTGAKYTYCHVLRSCAFAASYLPTLGATDLEVEAVLGAINCTGPSKQVSRLQFRQPVDRMIGCALATADYLGQMAAEDYPDELEILYKEFEESDDFIHVPASRRMFSSAADLIGQTPRFWREVVKPKLHDDFQALYRFLANPYPDGSNRYLESVEQNIALVEQRIGKGQAARFGA